MPCGNCDVNLGATGTKSGKEQLVTTLLIGTACIAQQVELEEQC